MTDNAKPADQITAAYMGRRINSKDKLVHMFRYVGGENDGGEFYYPKLKASRFAGAQIGRHYTFDDGEVPGSIGNAWQKFETGAEGFDQITAWQARDRLEATHHAATKIQPAPELDNLIDRLRAARMKTPISRRAAFDLWLIREIQKAR